MDSIDGMVEVEQYDEITMCVEGGYDYRLM